MLLVENSEKHPSNHQGAGLRVSALGKWVYSASSQLDFLLLEGDDDRQIAGSGLN